MKYDVFMRTRTHNGYDDWVSKPDYMPTNAHEGFQSLTGLCDNVSFGDLGWDDWDSNFFYLRKGGYCLLARVSRNQGVTSFEGISVKAEDEKRLFYNIPSLINELLPPAKSFRAVYEEEGAIPGFFEADLLLNPFDGYKIPAEVHPAVINNPAYRNLLKFIAFSERPTGFMFGKNARAFSEHIDMAGLRLNRVFDFFDPDSPDVNEHAFADSYTPIVCEYKQPVPTGRDKVAVCLLIQETGKNSFKYRWEVKPWDSSVKDYRRARYATRFFEVEDRVEFAKLELQKESIRRFLTNSGWTKQFIGLRFEKDLFQQE